MNEMSAKFKNRRRSSIMGYETSLMFGQYREQLATFARAQAQKASTLDGERRRAQSRDTMPGKEPIAVRIQRRYRALTRHGSDWLILASLGLIMALLSFVMDLFIHACYDCKLNDI